MELNGQVPAQMGPHLHNVPSMPVYPAHSLEPKSVEELDLIYKLMKMAPIEEPHTIDGVIDRLKHHWWRYQLFFRCDEVMDFVNKHVLLQASL